MKSNFEKNIKINQGNKINSYFLIHLYPNPTIHLIFGRNLTVRGMHGFSQNPIPTSPQSMPQSPHTLVTGRAGFTLQNTDTPLLTF